MTLRSNGSSYWTFPLRPGKTAYTVWEADEKYLRFGFRSVKTFQAGMQWFNARSPVAIHLVEDLWEVIHLSPDVIELTRPPGRTSRKPVITMTLRRIPE
jgi:hypothetical protein